MVFKGSVPSDDLIFERANHMFRLVCLPKSLRIHEELEREEEERLLHDIEGSDDKLDTLFSLSLVRFRYS